MITVENRESALGHSLRITQADMRRALSTPGVQKRLAIFTSLQGSEKRRAVMGRNVDRVKESVVREQIFGRNTSQLISAISHVRDAQGPNAQSHASLMADRMLTLTQVESNPSWTISGLPWTLRRPPLLIKVRSARGSPGECVVMTSLLSPILGSLELTEWLHVQVRLILLCFTDIVFFTN